MITNLNKYILHLQCGNKTRSLTQQNNYNYGKKHQRNKNREKFGNLICR